MIMKCIIITLSLIILNTVSSLAGATDETEVTELEPVLVTASRIPTKLSKKTRSISTITDKEIESMPVNSVPELLNYLAGIDMRQRNLYGVQADASIRGSSFDQVLILIDGINFNDPQTGHLSLDLPLALEDIERIEVLRGHGSSLYGANAFGGVINIITKKPASKRLTQIKASTGSSETYRANFSHTVNLSKFDTRLSLEKEKSNGYRSGTDFDHWGIFSNSTVAFPKSLLDLSLGFKDKKFGADSFYVPFSSQERTKTKFGTVKFQYEGIKNFTIEPKIYYREHYDKFILKRENPALYTNCHKNYKYGGEITCYISLNSWGDMVFGGEMGEEKIRSHGIRQGSRADALGRHRRQNHAIYTEYRSPFESFWVNVGGRFDHNSHYGDEFSPSLSLGWRFSDSFKLRFSLGRSFRAPTFTDLYYRDPIKRGNPDLKPEQAWSYELGGDFNLKPWMQGSITLFMRDEDDLIDWVGLKSEPDNNRIYYVKNISEVKVKGVESELKLKIGKSTHLTGGYTFIHKDPELESRYVSLYALNYPKHLLNFKIAQSLPYGIKGVLGGVYKKRIEKGGYFTLDLKLSKKVGRYSLFISGTNLLNKKYEDILGAEMPGVWISGGIKYVRD
ncbi:MAG: TonB-dependent receptor [Deltaproteobacteria bacterium]|nr:TonB-dependent receptor [Deltaproteobacteria bacterium]